MNAQTRTWMQRLRSKRAASYAAKLHHDERFDALRSMPVRRGLVAASFLLVLAAVVFLWWDVGAAFLASGLLAVGGYLLLNRAVRLVVDAPDEALDERFVAVRNAAYRTSYRGVVGVTGLALFAVSLAVDLGALDLGGHHLRSLLFGFIAVAVLTPTAVLAWREREI